MDKLIIEGTTKVEPGYAHIKYSCKLINCPEVYDVFNNQPIKIAEHLDKYRGNFGGRDFSLYKGPDGHLWYTGTIHTD